MGRVNKEWHEAHAMPNSPTKEQRVEWHAEHAECCGCREVPAGLAQDVKTFRANKAARAN